MSWSALSGFCTVFFSSLHRTQRCTCNFKLCSQFFFFFLQELPWIWSQPKWIAMLNQQFCFSQLGSWPKICRIVPNTCKILYLEKHYGKHTWLQNDILSGNSITAKYPSQAFQLPPLLCFLGCMHVSSNLKSNAHIAFFFRLCPFFGITTSLALAHSVPLFHHT